VEYLHHENSPVLAWVVEQGEDLHWLGPPLQLAQRVDHWLAGSATTAEELRTILAATTNITVCPEFVERPSAVDPAEVENRRAELMIAPPELAPANSGSHPIPDSQSPAMLVVGAGIGTWRKAPDLFLEVAASAERSGHGDTYVWIGGQSDDLHPKVAAEGDRLGLRRFVMAPSVPDLTNSLASADVFLHTARLDAFPLVCLHSILAGTPVVAFSGAGGVPEMLGSSFCGAEYPDLAGLSAAVEQLRDPSKRAAVAEA
jgi:glycosyltransferase involved in cell wall biosynthesis